MELNYNVTGKQRKEMVTVISQAAGMAPVYKGAPTFAYVIDNFTVSKDGTLSFDERTSKEEAEKVTLALKVAGFTAENAEAEDTAEPEGDLITIEMPREKLSEEAIENLKKIAESKAGLFKKAFEADELPINVTDEKVAFPWFRDASGEAVKAYTHFVQAICEMASTQKRVTATEKEVDNDKYAFRCFLLRLGFIGAEYKAERKVLLKNLTGSSAFKSGKKGGAA